MNPRRLVLLPGIALIASLAPTVANSAGPPPQPSGAQLALGLRKLGVVGSVLYVAAHPDDENTNLISFLANGALVRTGYLSVTRGDGGQNLIGSEQGPALGLIRTQELLAARRVDGGEQFFTRARDFGFSKSPDETLRIWDREAVLSDMVAVIRRFRPDVVVTRFSPLPADTHGHHTASAMLAVEAFEAAADPKFHPEQLTGGVEPWQARRLLWNKSSWSMKPTDDTSGLMKLDVGGYSPLLGASFGEIAAESRSMHKSQGFGVARNRGPIVEYFQTLVEGDAKPASLFAGIDTTWKRFKGGAALGALIDGAVKRFDPAAPAASIPALLEIERALEKVPDPSSAGWRARKREEVRALVLACAGLFVDATAGAPDAAPGTDVEVTATVMNRSPARAQLREIRFPFGAPARTFAPPKALAAEAIEAKQTVHLPATQPATTPYWLEAPPTAGGYGVPDPRLVGHPQDDPPLEVTFVLNVDGRELTVARAVSFKWTDPVMGERYRPFEVTPRVSVSPDTRVLMFPGDAPRTVSVRVQAGAPNVTGELQPELPSGWLARPASAKLALATKGAEATFAFEIRPASKSTAPATLRFVAKVGDARLSRGVVHLTHAHIPIQTFLVDADVRLVPLQLATGGKKLGYIPGPGDEVPGSLRRVGYDVTLLSDDALSAAALAPFDAVVVGVRAFNTSERLRAAHDALMAYVQAGGTLVVQYNTNSRLAPLSTPIGPWPFNISQQRVTDETAAVTFTQPKHPLVTTPNALGPRDFEGWVQERGLYFADAFDPKYETVFSLSDPGEKPLAGSTLFARHGKGAFVYTGLAFFRQLPAGVPGAYRLFANLLAGGRSSGR
jgi:LmbE family N-acetylglucosaminyl deacetylase